MNPIWYVFIGAGVLALLTHFALKRANGSSVPSTPTPKPKTPPTDPHGTGGGGHGHDDHHATAKAPSTWEKFWFWFGIIATLVVGVISIAGFINHQSNSRPERKEFSAYYEYWIEHPGGLMKEGDPVFVSISLDSIGTSYRDREDGGGVTFRWARQGDGVWTKVLGKHTSGSWLRVKNVSGNKEQDFKDWQHKILIEIGDDEDQSKIGKVNLIRR